MTNKPIHKSASELLINVLIGVVVGVVVGMVVDVVKKVPEKVIDGNSPTFLHTKGIFWRFESDQAIACEKVSKNYPCYQNRRKKTAKEICLNSCSGPSFWIDGDNGCPTTSSVDDR